MTRKSKKGPKEMVNIIDMCLTLLAKQILAVKYCFQRGLAVSSASEM